ncbi:GDP-L-fucose synthase family protein [Geofilum rhodophaeum]|uniref:GDP-L-fucose synthase family protein n=1 Tax=Geofilum rhodophaeum TaxID=1965019 RepID=UPI000B525488|nr:GDP-L-fucose synthase [Geofilum rhodophaeum]
MNKTSRIFIAGHKGLVGSAIYRHLHRQGYKHLLTADRQQLDLLDQAAVAAWFEEEKPEFVFLAAAKVGGIMANNTYRADFLYENLQIQNNIIHSAWKSGVKKLLFLGSSCIYPKECAQPMTEEALLTGPLEYTNEPYAIAKIAGMKMCEAYNLQYNTDFISVMPTNLYGPNDNYNLYNSHVLPALIRKMHLGKLIMEEDWNGIRIDLEERPLKGLSAASSEKQLTQELEAFGIFTNENLQVDIRLWGSGTPRREFLHSDDLAEAVVFVMQNISFNDIVQERGLKEVRNTHINIGSGTDLSIAELAQVVKKVVGFEGSLSWDSDKPDGTYQKLMDVSRLAQLGWKARIQLEDGIRQVYNSF